MNCPFGGIALIQIVGIGGCVLSGTSDADQGSSLQATGFTTHPSGQQTDCGMSDWSQKKMYQYFLYTVAFINLYKKNQTAVKCCTGEAEESMCFTASDIIGMLVREIL